MEISNQYPKAGSVNQSVSQDLKKAETAENARKSPDIEPSEPKSSDTVTLSSTSLKLAQTEQTSATVPSPAIQNNEQAQRLVSDIAINARSNPEQGRSAHGQYGSAKVASLLG